MFMIYTRVSSKDQNLDRQKNEVKKWLDDNNIDDCQGSVRWYNEKASGKNIEGRPVFKKLLDDLREDDTLIVLSLDRLGRNYDDIQATLYDIKKKGASFAVVDAPFLSPSAYPGDMGKVMSDMFISLFGYLAEKERVKIKERQKQGIEVAKARGAYNYERKKTAANAANYARLERELANGNQNRKDLETLLGVSRPTLLKMIKELGY